MKCTHISDTHTRHNELKLSGGDILFHTGDHSMLGQPDEVYPFLEWLAAQKYEHKVFIAGNHDWGWEPLNEGFDEEEWMFRGHTLVKKGLDKEYEKAAKDLGLIYLNNSGVQIEDVHIYGSPYSEEIKTGSKLHRNMWAFNYWNDAEHDWSHIPSNTDILLTHCPPFAILDQCYSNRVGSESLLNRIVQSTKPKFHLFGHIHEAHGRLELDGTTYMNSAIGYDKENEPQDFLGALTND